MAGSLNKVILIGRLGRDPELSYTANGQALAKLSVATDEGYRDKQTGQRVDRTEWHRVVVWRKAAEFCGNYLKKGSLVNIEGKLQTRKWQDQNGQDRWTTEIVADRVQGLDSPRDNSQQGAPQSGGYTQQGAPQSGGYTQQGAPQSGGYAQQGAPQNGGYTQQGAPQSGGYAQQGAPQNGGYAQQGAPQNGGYTQQGAPQSAPRPPEEDLGPAFPSEASGMDDVPF